VQLTGRADSWASILLGLVLLGLVLGGLGIGGVNPVRADVALSTVPEEHSGVAPGP
jgi:hypothetical protein